MGGTVRRPSRVGEQAHGSHCASPFPFTFGPMTAVIYICCLPWRRLFTRWLSGAWQERPLCAPTIGSFFITGCWIKVHPIGGCRGPDTRADRGPFAEC